MIESAKYRQRHGITIPRSSLLPPYMSQNPYYVEYTNAMDAIYGPTVDEQLHTLANLRNMWVQNTVTEGQVESHELIPNEAWSYPNRDLIVKQVNQLGMKLATAGIITDDAYQTIARFVGIYWFGKGTDKFMEFINYALSSDFQVQNLWTQDYAHFYPEGDVAIGTPIWDGGTWYPTTHVKILAKGGLHGIDIVTLQRFFYEIANYNLVLQSIDANYDMYVVPYVGAPNVTNVVAVALYNNYNIALSTEPDGTAPPPPYVDTNFIPTTYLAMGGVDVDLNTAFLLAEPTGWTWLDPGMTMKAPIYNGVAQTPAPAPDIGTGLIGSPVGGQFNVLYGPVGWYDPPGLRDSIRMPYYTTNAYVIKDSVSLPVSMVGNRRAYTLCNPSGFYQVEPGKWVPYWLA
jgi:hypothetical protein